MMTVDVAVVGAGMSGMVLAARAAQAGCRVAVFDRADAVGGSAVYAHGPIWTATSMDLMLAEDPDADQEFGSTLVREFEPTMDWVRSIGVTLSEPVGVLHFGRGYTMDNHSFFEQCTRIISECGGTLVLGVDSVDLRYDQETVIGLRVEKGDEQVTVESSWVGLCTGGFQASRELMSTHVTGGTPYLLRSNAYSDGAGIRLGQSAGGSVTEDAMGGSTATWCRPGCRDSTASISFSSRSTTAPGAAC